MSKIKIKTKINTENQSKTYETYGILKENTIIYYENQTKVKIQKKEDEIILLRNNEDMKLLFTFNDKNPCTLIDSMEGKFTIPLLIKQKKWDKNKITLEYKIEEDIKFELIWEEYL